LISGGCLQLSQTQARQEGRSGLTWRLFFCVSIHGNNFEPPKQREVKLVWIVFVNTRRKLGIHAQTLGTVLNRGVQADARGASQVLHRCVQAVVRGSCLSQVLDGGTEAVARGAVPCASQPIPAAPLAVRRRYLIVVLRPVLRPLLAATRHCRSRRRALGRCSLCVACT
jgi:hypothetical protein